MSEQVRPRLVLFDMDDTLVVTRAVKWQQHQFVAKEEYGLDLSEETLAQHWGQPFGPMLSALYQQAAPEAELIANYRKYHDLYPKLEQPGAVAGVKALLAAGYQVGVLTSMINEVAAADLARMGFPIDDFAMLLGADNTEFHKPDPRVFAPIADYASQQGWDLSEVVYVGDALIDEVAASGAGLGFIGVTTGMAQAEDFPAGTPVFPGVAAAINSLL
ncbi:hypothetical protein BK816_06765 [Boudabousia tangfeifanii]|uniref:Haloacid dehalogenase n=1 Tax=Boudabousia tangfeifanii TaxID=1912795 RepID=A0A1D9ML73_9ACTO|nr:HAD hydrolase-like protein [Boudabousia tangfeifanii]AOZ73025.1 hypothetical protein BK816_06765 [Boudabousia tangfeifanii]